MKIRNKISISLILFTVGILVAQLFVEQVTIYSKSSKEVEELADLTSDLDDSENNSEEGSEENVLEGDDQLLLDACLKLYLFNTISENKIHMDGSEKIYSITSEIFENPPEFEV